MQHYNHLKMIFEKYSKLGYNKRLLLWDNMVMMPSGAASYHAEAISLCDQMSRKLLISKKTASTIEAAQNEHLASLWDSQNLFLMEKQYQTLKSVPIKLLSKSTEANAKAVQAWKKYKPQNNWQEFMPFLQRSFKCLQEIAEVKSQALQITPYETLIEDFAPSIREKQIDQWIIQLKPKIIALRQRIRLQQQKDMIIPLEGQFSLEKQKALIHSIAELFGFDFNFGRIDTSHHPYSNGLPFDMRITTCYDEENPFEAIFSITHELGHGIYEQGIPKEWAWQPVGQTQDKALHESQALLFEYHIGHSMPFLEILSQKLEELFGVKSCLETSNLFKIVNRVNNSLKRLDADEVSYPLHTLLRYEIEKALFSKDIEIADLPSLWNEKMQHYFGLSPDSDNRNGVMQDIHWSMGYFGYFPSYLLGQLIAAQLDKAFRKAMPSFDDKLKNRNMSSLKNWLSDHIYSSGSTLTRDELLIKISGEPLNTENWIEHIQKRYCVTLK